ncbi:unnamed protein product, partial [Mesorhabditis belari]|uniref:Gustatory receptor n=1 Tax=Mesorhabditis belari TaxID=2138241 RepID=A0AAF3FCM5_9BILA
MMVTLASPEELPSSRSEDDEDHLKFVRRDGKVLTEDGCNLLEMDMDDPACRQFILISKFISVMGLCYKPFSSLYTGVFDFYHSVYRFDPKSSGRTYQWIVIIIQALVSQIFLTRVQMNLGIPRFFHTLKHFQIDDGGYYDKLRNRSISNHTRRFLVLFGTGFISVIFYLTAAKLGFATAIIHPSFLYTFIYPELLWIRHFLIFYSLQVWTIALHVYMCLANIMYWEAKKFNRKLRALNTSTPDEMVKKVEEMILLHTHLNKCVRELDRIFKIYAFLIICSIIPSTLFTLTLVLTRDSLSGLMLCIPTVLMCLYGYIGATLTPATLHEESNALPNLPTGHFRHLMLELENADILQTTRENARISFREILSKSKATLCMNNNLWVPFDEKVNKVAHTLVMHLEQADLGISLWGFALVTKPMILTTFSVMMTCLAFFLEFRPKETA